MIDRLARILAAAFPDLEAEQLAEAVLLATRSAESGGHSAESLTPPGVAQAPSGDAEAEQPTASSDAVPTAADLTMPAPEEEYSLTAGEVRVTEVGLRLPATVSRALATATALSQFRRVCRPGPPVVDVDATVEATADAQRLVVVTRPGRERGLDAAIVLDPSLVALAWSQVIDELEGTLRRTGAFRSVTRWTLDHTTRSASGEPFVRDNAGVVHRADQLVDPAGRRLMLVLSDGTGDAWWRSGTWQVLRRWARVMPTTLVHLLPPSYWGWTAIGQPCGVVRSLRPAEPNATMEFRPAWWSDDEVPSGYVPVPVIDLDPDAIVRWARAIVSGSIWTEAVWTHHPPRRTADVASGAALSATDRVSIFEMRASAGAQRLARVLAGAPLLSLPLIQLLHEHVVPDASTSQVAELLVSGLLEHLPEKPGERSPLLRFLPGVGDLLYRGTTISQEWDLYDLLTGFLEQNAESGDMIHALMSDPGGGGVVTTELVPFAAMGRRMALRLGLDLGAPAPAPLSVADTPPVSSARRYLLICAIGEYDDTAITDIPRREEKDLLTRVFESMGYTTIPVPPRSASRFAVLEAARRFYRDADRHPDDLVVFYLSSHGHLVEGGEFRLLAADTRHDNITGTGIAIRDLASLMFQGPTVCRNLVLIDSAYASAAASELTSAAVEAPISWFSVVASAGAQEVALVNNFSRAMASTIEEWLAEPAGQSILTLNQLLRGINGRMSRRDGQHARSETFAITDSATSVYFTRQELPPFKSAYLEVVRQIAPARLMDRGDELAKLATFCTAPGSGLGYLILTAPPWAGKSALLASFVLAPPPGLRVVAFFVTSRLPEQNTRAAFVDVMIEQLAGLLNEQLPALPTETTREMHWLEMLNRAAVSCQRAGQRLVLVADGLDEDRGITAGADSHSIAALLPAQPPAGMRVIVATRSSSAVPSDVPSDHPLRGSEHWSLSPSPHGRVVQWRIKQDLRRVFDDAPITIDIIGFIVESRGGLSGPDIAELTGLQSSEVENGLAAAGGLLITRRSRLRPDTMLYLVFHEELQNLAVEMLGPRLRDYQRRLEAWVAKYRSRNWPPDTPEYPLIGCFQRLASTDSVSQMLELVLDRHRQDRLHNLTGNDEVLLDEIITLIETPIDLRHEKRLASLLAVIEHRSPHVLVALPTAWAALGDMPRAEQLAHTIVTADERARAFADLARARSQLGDLQVAVTLYEQALSIYRETGDRHSEGVVLADLARARAQLGDLQAVVTLYEQALSIYRETGDRHSEGVVLADLARARAQLGDLQVAVTLYEQALSIYRETGDRHSEGVVLADLARTRAQLGDLQAAVTLYEQALSIYRETGDRHSEGVVLADVARARAQLGDLQAAVTLYEQALSIYRETGDRHSEGVVLADLARTRSHPQYKQHIQGGRSASHASLWRQAVRIMADTGSGYRLLGSGYAIGGHLVLTAGDIFAETVSTESRSDMHIGICRKGESVTMARIVWANRHRDGVLLESPDMTPAPPVQFGRAIPGQEIACQFIGFPSQLQRPEWTGHIESVSGRTRANSSDGGSIEIVEVGHLTWHPTPAWSSLEGTSGSALFAGSYLIGVVSKHGTASAAGTRPVVAISVAEFFEDLEFVSIVEAHVGSRPVLGPVEM